MCVLNNGSLAYLIRFRFLSGGEGERGSIRREGWKRKIPLFSPAAEFRFNRAATFFAY